MRTGNQNHAIALFDLCFTQAGQLAYWNDRRSPNCTENLPHLESLLNQRLNARWI